MKMVRIIWKPSCPEHGCLEIRNLALPGLIVLYPASLLFAFSLALCTAFPLHQVLHLA